MSDNVKVSEGSGPLIASDDVAGVQYQRVKPAFGGDGEAADVSVINPLPATLIPGPSGGLSKTAFVSAASTNGLSAKGSPGQVYGWLVSNEEASWIYLKFFDTAGTPTPGTTNQFFVVGVPPGGTARDSHPNGIAFPTGIGIGLTKGMVNSNSEAVSANKVAVAVFWK